ncbi:hypothetical protein [Glaciibacter superstes]|uniref:hypothetical protein n=1 Tax=Glaciibacter superstes TaxID=501023 RepID=UPI000426C3E6|nr:hypothetical protein [Glaciibacter superstes]
MPDQLRRALELDPALQTIDPELDSDLILATISGLSQGMLPGHYSADTAIRLIDRVLDRLLGTAVPPHPAEATSRDHGRGPSSRA